MEEIKTLSLGAARRDITPAVGTLLYGYNPHQVSTSVHDPIHVTAMALANGTETALMLSVEVGDMQTEYTTSLRESASQATGVPVENILISATHTHSAPNVAGMEGWGGIDEPYAENILRPRLVEAVVEAIDRLEPVTIGYGTTKSYVGINRRQQLRDGTVDLGQNPHGCMDPKMTVISFRSVQSGKNVFTLVHYGCHGTSAGCNHEISRDWSGIMIDRLEAETGVLTAFWNGAIGDIGPRLTNGKTVGDIHYTEELGGVAAMDALRAYGNIGGYHPSPLTLFHGELHLPYRALPTLDEVEEKLAAYAEPEKLINIERLTYHHWREVAEALRDPNAKHPTERVVPQTIVVIGDAVFIPFTCEVFSEITLRLREYSPYPHTLTLSNTNGYTAYLPSEDQICRGGYEVMCFRYGSVYTLTDDADQHYIDENLRILGV